MLFKIWFRNLYKRKNMLSTSKLSFPLILMLFRGIAVFPLTQIVNRNREFDIALGVRKKVVDFPFPPHHSTSGHAVSSKKMPKVSIALLDIELAISKNSQMVELENEMAAGMATILQYLEFAGLDTVVICPAIYDHVVHWFILDGLKCFEQAAPPFQLSENTLGRFECMMTYLLERLDDQVHELQQLKKAEEEESDSQLDEDLQIAEEEESDSQLDEDLQIDMTSSNGCHLQKRKSETLFKFACGQ